MLESCIANIYGAVFCKHLAVSGVPCGKDAIEHVCSQGHKLNKIFGCAGTQDLFGFSIRKYRKREIGHFKHDIFWLSHTETAYGITAESDLNQSIR